MAKNLNQSLADAAKKSIHERREKRESEAPKPHGVLGNRIQAASELARGERVKRVQYMVDPASCRLWEQHNRRYDLLNETRCADLIGTIDVVLPADLSDAERAAIEQLARGTTVNPRSS